MQVQQYSPSLVDAGSFTCIVALTDDALRTASTPGKSPSPVPTSKLISAPLKKRVPDTMLSAIAKLMLVVVTRPVLDGLTILFEEKRPVSDLPASGSPANCHPCVQSIAEPTVLEVTSVCPAPCFPSVSERA